MQMPLGTSSQEAWLSHAPLGGLAPPHPVLPKLGSTLITSLPKGRPHQPGWSHRLCWRLGVLEGAWPMRLLAGPFTASSPSSPFGAAPHPKRL